jgi:tRNA (cmo5U34)-methyltransferase
MSMGEQPRFGGEWVGEAHVADYIARMDAYEDADRLPIFQLMTRLATADPSAPLRILDVGSGYGPVAAVCLDAFPNATAIGLDISEAMMAVGRERMARFGPRFTYMVGDFSAGALPPQAVAAGPYDLVVSARAIHHLPAEGMAALYADICRNLRAGGAFFNLDTASTETDFLHERFRAARPRRARPAGEERTPAQRAHDALHHHRDATLVCHLEWLKAAGFASVDCYWKHLDRALVGGFREA